MNVPSCNVNLQDDWKYIFTDVYANILNEAPEEKQKAAGGKNQTTAQFKAYRPTATL